MSRPAGRLADVDDLLGERRREHASNVGTVGGPSPGVSIVAPVIFTGCRRSRRSAGEPGRGGPLSSRPRRSRRTVSTEQGHLARARDGDDLSRLGEHVASRPCSARTAVAIVREQWRVRSQRLRGTGGEKHAAPTSSDLPRHLAMSLIMAPADTDKSSRRGKAPESVTATQHPVLTPVRYGDVAAETTDWTAAGERSQQADRVGSPRSHRGRTPRDQLSPGTPAPYRRDAGFRVRREHRAEQTPGTLAVTAASS